MAAPEIDEKINMRSIFECRCHFLLARSVSAMPLFGDSIIAYLSLWMAIIDVSALFLFFSPLDHSMMVPVSLTNKLALKSTVNFHFATRVSWLLIETMDVK